MPLDGTPPAGAGEGTGSTETRVELKTPITNEQSASEALAGLLDLGDDAPGADGVEHKESGASAPDTGAEETPPTGDEEGHSEPPAEGAIEPPNSLTAEEKDAFAKLPPEAQRMIARRESDREKAFTQRSQEIADERKGWEAERAAIATQRQQYLQSLQALVHLAIPEAQQFAQIDWDRLAQENPAAWAQLTQRREGLRQRANAISAEIQQVQQQQAGELAQRAQNHLAQEHQLLIQVEPDFGDKEKGQKLARDLSSYLQSQFGFKAEEIGRVADHRMLRLALSAMRAHQTDEARASAASKRSNTPPRVQGSGSPQGSDATAQQRAKGLIERFGRTNSTRDAASILEAFL